MVDVEDGGLGSVDCWVDVWLGVFVDTVQVEAECVEAPVTSGYTVRIKKRYHFKNIIVK